MRYLVTGATGFVGRRLVKDLGQVVVLSRDAQRAALALGGVATCHTWNPDSEEPPLAAFDGVDAVVHLAGDPISEGRWTPEKKARIYRSRIEGTRHLVAALGKLPEGQRPSVLVSSSAVGYYGDRGDEELREDSAAGSGFMADVCREWEAEAARATDFGVRVVQIRTGVVLGREAGALAKMLLPFQMGVGGPLGNGRQWMPWIHHDDIIGLIHFAAGRAEVQGPLNAVAPGVVTNAEFSRALGSQLHRPAFLPVPVLAIKLLFGEMSNVLLSSQRVIPQTALDHGYQFTYRTIEVALRAALGSVSARAVSHVSS